MANKAKHLAEELSHRGPHRVLRGDLALVGLPMSRAESDVSYIGDGLNPWLTASHLIGWLAAAGLIVLFIAALRFWKAPGLGWWARVHATLLLLASITFMTFAWYGHLLSPSLKF